MGTQLFSMKQNYIRVCVNSDNPDIEGIAYSLLADSPIEFFSLAEFMLKIDSIFDAAGYPQAFEEKRSFLNKAEKRGSYHGIPKIKNELSFLEEQFGEIYTLELYVESRRKTNWQGCLYLIKKNGTEKDFLGTFESEMELLKILEKIE